MNYDGIIRVYVSKGKAKAVSIPRDLMSVIDPHRQSLSFSSFIVIFISRISLQYSSMIRTVRRDSMSRYENGFGVYEDVHRS